MKNSSLLCLVFVLAFTHSAYSCLGADWPQFLGPNGNGTSSETGLLAKWTEEGPPLVWEKKIGSGYGAPSVLGHVLVFQHRQGDEEKVEAVEAATGKGLWSYSYPSHFIDPYGYNNGPRSSPLLTTNRCYTLGAEGKLLCLDLNSGKPVWQHDTASEWKVPEAFFGVGSSPTLEGGRLLVMLGGQPNSGVVAFDPATGKVLWESVGAGNWEGLPKTGWPGEPIIHWRDWEKQASYASPVYATVHGLRRALCFMRQGLVMLDPITGRVDDSYWFRARVNESVNASSPVVVGNEVLISSAYYKSGAVLLRVTDEWKFDVVWRGLAIETHWNTPIFVQGYLYAFSGRNEPDARFRCVEFQSGKVMWDRDESWSHNTRTPDRYGRGSCLMADGKLIVLGEGGLLGLFRPNSKAPEELCRAQIPHLQYPCWAGPVLADKRLYLRSDGDLVCLDLAAVAR